MTSLISATAFATEILMLLVIKDGPSLLCLYRAKKTPTLRHWRRSSSPSPATEFPSPFTVFPLFDTELWWLIVNFASSFANVALMEVLKKNFSSYSAGKCGDCCSGSWECRECSCNQKSIQSPRITTKKTHWTIFMFSELFMVTCFSSSVSPSLPDIASQQEALGTGSLHSLSHWNIVSNERAMGHLSDFLKIFVFLLQTYMNHLSP